MKRAIICQNLNFFYVSIPKCGCTSLKYWIYNIEFNREFKKYTKDDKRINIHNCQEFKTIPSSKILEEKQDYKVITIVRDPIERFLSAYSNRVIHHKQLSEQSIYKDQIAAAGLKFNPDINYFVENLESYQKCAKPIWHHTKPVINIIGSNLDLYTNIYRIREMNRIREDFLHDSNSYSYLSNHTLPEIPRLQMGGPKLKLDVLQPSIFDKLLDYYAKDYELLQHYYPIEKIKQKYGSICHV